MLNVPRSLILRYIVAVLAVALALGLTSLLWPVLKPSTSLLFFAAVMFSAWYGGLGPGLLSTLLSTLAIIYFFDSPTHTFKIDVADILRLGVFVLVSLLISSLNGLRQNTERLLRKKEEQIRLITDSVPTLISYVDAGQRYRYNNRTYEEWFGHRRTDITGKHLKDVMGESAYQAIQTYVEAALSGQEVTFETAVTLENAGRRYIRATYVPDFGKQQQPKGFVALVDDITERKQAEEALQKERDFSSAVLSTVGSLVVVLDQEGRIAQFNKACEKITGYSFEEVRGKCVWDLFLIPEEVEPVKAVFENLSTSQLPNEYENYWLTKDGNCRLIAWSNTTLKDDEGLVQYIIGTGIDITERKQAEEALRQSEERLRLALDAAQMGTWDWNLLTGQVTWSEHHEQLFGIAPGTFEGTYEAFLRRVYREDREVVAQLLNGIRLERGIYDQEFRVVWDDGSIHWVAAKGRFFYNPSGQPVRMIGVVLGITKRKQAEELLQTFALELERQVEARTVELASTNAALEAEIAERRRAQEALFQSQQSIQNLYEIVAAPHVDFKEKIQKLLAMGCDRFGLDMGILAQITRERYEVVAVQFSENLTSSNNVLALSPGDIFELGQTYCNETLQAKEPMSFEHAGSSELWKGHPCYRTTQLEAYMATRIIVAGEVYGTLNFSSPTPRLTPFQAADKEFLKLMALWIGGEIARQQAEEELYQREQQFKAVVENTPDVIIRCDTQLRYAYVNPAVERNTGVPSAQFIGKTPEETGAPSHLCQLWNETLLKVFQTGTEQIIEYQAPSISGMRTYQSRIVPELDKDDTAQYALIVARDITELRQAEEERAQLIREQTARLQAEEAQKRSAFLVEVSTVLASSLDYETTLKSVARLAVPYMADWCSVNLVSEEGRIRCVEVAHLNPAKVEIVQDLLRRYPPEQNPQSPIMKVLRTGKSELIAEVPDALLTTVAQDAEYLRILRELNPKSYMVVPLRIRGRTLGILSFAIAESMRRYTPKDLDLAEELAYRAAVAVDNALLYQESERARRAAQQAKIAAERAAERTSRLQGITAALSESLTPVQVAEVIIEQGVMASGANSAFIAVLTKNGTELEVLGAPGYDTNVLEEWRRFPIHTPVPLAEAVRTGKPIWLESTAARIERYPHLANEYSQAKYGGWLSLPLTVEGRAVGGMSLSFSEVHPLSEDDRAFILALAQQCAQAIERTRLYEAERLARTAAEAANRTKDEFLATLSHELRTPLNAMLGWTKLLRTRKFDEATAARALETIDRNTKSLATLIEDVLDVSRIIRGKLHLHIRPLELTPVIKSAIDAVQSAADAKTIQIEPILDPSAGMVSGDPDRLQQVVWNLLSNAIKFTPKGGRVEVELSRLESFVQIRVSDTGKGISPEFLPFVFDRFRQADSSITRSYGGLGLGLAIVRHLVEMHGGTVRAESPGEGQGATFIVHLPMRVLSTPANVPLQSSVAIASEESSDPTKVLDNLRILVVDDEADARELLSTLLTFQGADVKAAASAGEALEMLQSWKPNLLISDIGMPQEDGYTLIRKVRMLESEALSQLPAIALTAYAREEDRIHALEAGFQQHLSKPTDPNELVNAIAQLVGGAQGN